MKRMPTCRCLAFSIVLVMMVAPSQSAKGQDDTVGTLVDMGTFSVNVPDLDDWTVDRNLEKGIVELSRSKQKLLSLFSSGAGGGSSMTVFRNRPGGGTPGIWLMNEQQTADNFRASEAEGLLQDRRLNIVAAERDSIMFEGKRYYRFLYAVRLGKATSESILYLYFPPEFPRTKEFFGFLISESYVTGSIFASKDLDQIKPLLRSLKTDGSTSTFPGVKGELLRAAANGDSATVKRLVESGVDVNAVPRDGRGPLALAALYGHERIVRYLADHGALVNPLIPWELHSPLTSAILGRETRIAGFLLERGARANTLADSQWTPLIRAITMHLDTGFVANLLAHGADPNLGIAWTPLMHAANEGLAPVVAQLLDRGAVLDFPNANGETALILALKGNSPEAAEVLLARGANPNAGSKNQMSPLIWAARAGDTASITRLLNMGARVNACNDAGTSALGYAALRGHPECIRLLAGRGATIDLANMYGFTALHLAVLNSHPDCALVLMEKGADINARTKKGATPLMLAAEAGDSAVIRLLLSHGPKLDIENDDGDTALEIADDKDFDAIVAMLKKAGAKD
jgi:uncharacterized protein